MPQLAIPLLISGISVAASAGIANQQKKAMASAQAQQQVAQNAQMRASRAAEEDAQLTASTNESASTRIARAAGKRILAFQGNDAGLQPGASRGTAAALGG